MEGNQPLQPGMEAFRDPGVTMGSGPTMGRREVRLFDFSGEHYEMGYQQGLQAREAILQLAESLPQCESVRAEKPFYMPIRGYIYMLASRAAKEFLPDLTSHYPNQRKRLEGLARGSQLEEEFFCLVMSLEIMRTHYEYSIGGCTAAAVAAERCSQGEPALVKNLDIPSEFQPSYITRLSQPVSGLRSLEVTNAANLGCYDGVNERGLAVSYNYAFGTDMPKAMAPVSLLVQEILENCSTVQEAVEMARGSKRAGGALLLLLDADGDMASVELSPNFSGVRGPEDGILVNTNHFLTSDTAPYSIPSNAYYSSRAPRGLRGLRVHESSELRLSRALQLLGEQDLYALKELVNVFSDHGEAGRGDNNSICRHGEYFSTTCSLIILPRSRRMLVTYGNPCDSIFTDFSDTLVETPPEP
jgi:hypothetical protein